MRYWLIAALVSVGSWACGVDAQEKQLRIRVIDGDKDVELVELAKDGKKGPDEKAVERKLLATDAPAYWIGVAVGELSETTASQLNLDHGLVAEMVTEDSPAAKAGLQQHDILLTFGDAPLHTMMDLIKRVEATGPKKSMLEIVRKGERKQIQITPEKRPAAVNQPPWTDAKELFKGQADLEKLLREAMKDPNSPGRFLLVRPPIFEQGAKMPKHLKFNIQHRAGEPSKVEVWVDDKKYEAESVDKLPPEVQKYIDLARMGPDKMKLDPAEIMKFRTELPKFQNAEKDIADALQKMQKQMESMQEQLRKLQGESK